MAFRAYDVLKLVEEHGEDLTLRKIVYGSYDPQTSLSSSSSVDTHSITGYFYTYNLGVIDPENFVRGGRKCVIAALGLTVIPDTDDEITGNGNKVHITNVLMLHTRDEA